MCITLSVQRKGRLNSTWHIVSFCPDNERRKLPGICITLSVQQKAYIAWHMYRLCPYNVYKYEIAWHSTVPQEHASYESASSD